MSWGSTVSKKQADSGLTKATQDLLNDAMQKRGLSLRAMQDVSGSLRRKCCRPMLVRHSGSTSLCALPCINQHACNN